MTSPRWAAVLALTLAPVALAADKPNVIVNPHDALYWRFSKQMAIRQGDWKLVRYDLAAEGKSGLSPACLYNLKDDIGEATDLSAGHPDKLKALQAAWDAWDKSIVPPLWGGDVVK